ncbi:JmjC domain-containing protein [Undibacterium sp. KW1]|uniref:JmjC domain-containing protein n=1 Tax=Undibacterium sp. KW1 TaxID=2058624 RepID=UPI0013896214|nr:cupin domain-containing protein [Undibacterium sp. KW1]
MQTLFEIISSASTKGTHLHLPGQTLVVPQFGLDEVETYLFTIAPFPLGVVQKVSQAELPSDLLDQGSEDAFKAFSAGQTLVLHGVQRRVPSIALFAGKLSKELHCEVRINAYVTPPNSTGFALHFDEHDVLVVQTSGTKKWTLLERVSPVPFETTLMAEHQRAFVKSIDTARHAVLESNIDNIQINLAVGEMLFLPRGVPHKAYANRTPSVHLSIALIAPSRAEVAGLAAFISSTKVNLGSQLHFEGDPLLEASFGEDLLTTINALEAIRRQRQLIPVPSQFLYSLSHSKELTTTSELEWRGNIYPWMGVFQGDFVVVIHDRILKTDTETRQVWTKIIGMPRFRVEELPLDGSKRCLEFAAELVRLGVVQLTLSEY